MKKILALFIGIITLCILVSCNSKIYKEDDRINEGSNPFIESDGSSDESIPNASEENNLEHGNWNSEEQSPIITIEELPLDIKILEPDSMGIRYMEATYTNESPYKIQGMNITILLKDKMENAYLSTYNVVLPGETSPKFETYAPTTGKLEDCDYVLYEISIVKEDGAVVHLIYDVKEDKYTWF